MKRIPIPVENILNRLNINYSYHEHPPVATVAESELIKEQIIWIHTKNLFLSNMRNRWYLVSLQAQARLPINQLRKQLGEKELTFGSPDEVYEQLWLKPWSVSLFGLINKPANLTLILDTTFIDQPAIGWHPNRNDATIMIAYADAIQLAQTLGYNALHLALPHNNTNNELKLW
jgi:Ala-tRNA(Pro) deacylase